MKKAVLIVLVGILLGLSACAKDGATPTATAAYTIPAPAGVSELSPAELITSPTAFENRRVQVTGRYGVLPAPACSGVLQLAPGAWALSEAGVIIRVSGLESVVLPLAPDGLAMQVEGNWRRWDGLVGCGNAAVSSTVWYLEAERILFPNPLSRSTLTPIGPVAETTETPVPGMTSIPAVVASSPTPFPTATQTPSVPASPTVSPSATVIATATPTYQPSPLATPTPSPTSLQSPLATPNGGGDAGSNTPWPTFTLMPTPTSSPSPTTGASQSAVTIDMGTLTLDLVVNETLEAGEMHRWHLTGSAGAEITVTVAAAPGLDLELSIVDPQGIRLSRQGDRPAGQTETVEGLQLPRSGDYSIQIRELDGMAGDYAVIAMGVGSAPIVFPGNLNYGDQAVKLLGARTTHIWHFLGTTGAAVTLLLEPDAASDGVLVVYGPEGVTDRIAELDSHGTGDAEQGQVQLTETGFHSIRVLESSGKSGSYRLTLNR